MRPISIAVMFVAVVAGCSKSPPPINVFVSQPTAVDRDTRATSPTSPTPAVPYRENTDVERWLHRAAELEQKGQFESAMSLVHEALRIDANSPSAILMNGHLDEIIKRI